MNNLVKNAILDHLNFVVETLTVFSKMAAKFRNSGSGQNSRYYFLF